MRYLFAFLVALHGLIHLLGFVKAFQLAEVSELRTPISSRAGLLWLAAAVILVVAAALLVWAPRYWWLPGLTGVLLSQALILGAWQDARFGTVANVLILLPLLLAVVDHRPGSLSSRYLEAAGELEASPGAAHAEGLVTEGDLAGLPGPVERWLRRIGVVGRPRVHGFELEFEAAIRDAPDASYMRGRARQRSHLPSRTRVFFMEVTRAGLPVDVLHWYAGGQASMEARLLGLVPVVDTTGPDLSRSETVTFLNDLFLFAPAAVPFAGIRWEETEEGRVRAVWENEGHRVSAVLHFDQAGDLADFHSDDRYRIQGDTAVLERWSTPILSYQEVDGLRLPREAEARWGAGEDRWSYARFVLEAVVWD